jgi:bacillithiol biosynthesis cysteine-adding enzyme BshC
VFFQSGLSATAARLPVDIRRFPWIRRLAADYAFAFDQVADFYAGNPADPGAWRDAIARTQRLPRQRDAVADVLLAQQASRGAPAAATSAAARLRDPRTVAIVTGQQAGLFGGPLFTLLKAITAIRLAERVTAEYRIPAVPIFWIDAEDHDWDEVKSCGLLDAELNLVTVSARDPEGANERPVGWLRLDESITNAIDTLEAALPGTEFTPACVDQLRRAYRPGAGMVDAFGQWLESLLGLKGLVVFDASDPAAKRIAADVFAREVAHPGETARLAAEAGAALQARGYHAQATPQEGTVALFHLDGGRLPLRQQDGRFVYGDRSASRQELLDHVRRAPDEFSPNVLLRPLVQDTLFPTICYIAGPNELGYLGQLRGVYEAFAVPMPLIQQRATATILDSNSMRFLTRHDFPLENLRAQDEAALNQLLEAQLPRSVEASLEDAARTVDERMETLAKAVPQIDATLEGATRSTLGRMQDDLKKLHGKIIQAAKRKDETLRRQFKHAQAQAFPGGQPQERTLGFVYFLNKFGPTLVDRLGDELTLDMGNHWALTI